MTLLVRGDGPNQQIVAPGKGRGTAERPRFSHKKRVMRIGGENEEWYSQSSKAR
jgi:hypothetical protein